MEAAAALGGLGLPGALIVLILLVLVLLLAAALHRSAPRETTAAPQDGEYRADSGALDGAEGSVAEPEPPAPPLPQGPGRTDAPGRRSRGRRSWRRGHAGRSRSSSTASHTGCWSLPSRYGVCPGLVPPRC